jgi:hypothetical protein
MTANPSEDCQLPAISAPRSDEDHQSTPDDHRRFGDAGPRRVPSIFVGAAPNADDSHNDVGKRKEMETDGDSVGQPSEDRSDGGRRPQNIGDGALGDGVVPKGLAKRKIATPKRYQCVSHDARALFEFRAVAEANLERRTSAKQAYGPRKLAAMRGGSLSRRPVTHWAGAVVLIPLPFAVTSTLNPLKDPRGVALSLPYVGHFGNFGTFGLAQGPSPPLRRVRGRSPSSL